MIKIVAYIAAFIFQSTQLAVAAPDQIHKFRVVAQKIHPNMRNRLQVIIEVEYTYSGRFGDSAILTAWVRRNGKKYESIRSGDDVVWKGRSKSELYLWFDPDAVTQTIETNEIAFGFYEAGDGSSMDESKPVLVASEKLVWNPKETHTSSKSGVVWRVSRMFIGIGVHGEASASLDLSDPAIDSMVHREGCLLGRNAQNQQDRNNQFSQGDIMVAQGKQIVASSPLKDCESRASFALNRGAQERARQLAERQADQRLQAFATRHGVTHGWVNWRSFKANPFAAEGQILLFNVELKSMVTATEGLFTNCLFVDIPRNAIVEPRPVVIAGKVLGVTKAKVGPYEMQVPKIKYIGHEFCGRKDCKDIGTWHNRN